MASEEHRAIVEGNDEGLVTLKYLGRSADEGRINLNDYADSLSGWKEFFELSAEIYRRSTDVAQEFRKNQGLRIEVVAERKGSYEVVFWIGLTIAAGVIGNRADAVATWSYRRLMGWFKSLAVAHLAAKRQSTNVDEIISAIEGVAQREGVMFSVTELAVEDTQPDSDGVDDESTDVDRRGSVRVLVEKIDHALRAATTPLDRECDRIELVDDTTGVIVAFDSQDRAILLEPLTLPPPEGIWRQISVRFERINRKTGRALIYLEPPESNASSASYARIIDQAVHIPGNSYTESFNADIPLLVWARQIRGERGRLNLMWELTVVPPNQFALFGSPGSRA